MNQKQAIAGILLVLLIVSSIYAVFILSQSSESDDVTAPIVTIISPTNNTMVSGQVTISFNTTDDSPITTYEIRIDSILKSNEQAYSWDTTMELNGVHVLFCRAMDNFSNWGEAIVSVMVNNTETINHAPIVTIDTPGQDEIVTGTVLISVSVDDEESLNPSIFIDNEYISGTGSFLWNTEFWSNDIHTISANVTDSGGLTGSDSIQVTVDNKVALLNFTGEFKVMTYNIEQSGINEDWKEVVKEENPDIMILVETGTWEDNNDLLLNEAIDELNDYFVDEVPYIGYCAQGVAYSTSGEAILSRFPILDFIQIPIVPLDDETSYDVTHDFIHAVVNVNGTIIHLIGAHLKASSGVENEQRREWEMEGIINYMDNLGDVPIMFMGDLNSFSPADTGELAPLGDLGYGPLTMLLYPEDPTYGQYSSEMHNFTDVFRTLNPIDPGYTYGHQSPSYLSRIDYIVANDFFADYLINSTCGDTPHAYTGSDHYSVDVWLGWESTNTSDITPPVQVTGLNAFANYTSQVDLWWDANNETDLYRYIVYRDSVKIAEVITTWYNDTGLASNTTFSYQVSAIDINGNEGQKSVMVNVTTWTIHPSEAVVINEILPDPYSIFTDEWIELYNPTGEDIDLAGYILDDIIGGGTAPYTIPEDTIIPGYGFLLFYLAETGVALNNAGDTVNLIKPDGVTVLDSYTYSSSSDDISHGREKDGGLPWITFSNPTPGASNNEAIFNLHKSFVDSFPIECFIKEITIIILEPVYWPKSVSQKTSI
ncbi:hypothetical protein EU527_14535 [Candidatus Thorarchaeota archaeon]|nr:MAG: hypothetical protein EU527_14535 [Candidatus Thorarchaeota archaeon]